MNKKGNTNGTGFLVKREFVVTCHHNICELDEIYVGKHKDRMICAEWSEEFSDMKIDLAVLKVKNSPFQPLKCAKDIFPELKVCIRGFSVGDYDQGGIISGTIVEGMLGAEHDFYWPEESVKGKRIWNMKPSVNVKVCQVTGQFDSGFSGAPVWEANSGKVVGMFEAKNDESGYVILVEYILDKFVEERFTSLSALGDIDVGASANDLTNKGDDYLGKRNFVKAIKEYDKLLDQMPRILDRKGFAYHNLRMYNKAIECYDKALQIEPNLAFAWNNKGIALHNLKRYSDAIECYDKAIEIDPSYTYAWLSKGHAFGDVKEYSDAIECYDKAIEIDPSYTYAWLSKGRVLDSLGRHKEARRCFKQSKLSNL